MHFQVLRQGGNKAGTQGGSLTVTLRDLSPFSLSLTPSEAVQRRVAAGLGPRWPRALETKAALRSPGSCPAEEGVNLTQVGALQACLLTIRRRLTGSRSRPERRSPRPVKWAARHRAGTDAVSGKETTVKSEGLCFPPTENSVGESTLWPPNAR